MFTILHWIFDYSYAQWAYSFLQKFAGEKNSVFVKLEPQITLWEVERMWNKNRNIIFKITIMPSSTCRQTNIVWDHIECQTKMHDTVNTQTLNSKAYENCKQNGLY